VVSGFFFDKEIEHKLRRLLLTGARYKLEMPRMKIFPSILILALFIFLSGCSSNVSESELSDTVSVSGLTGESVKLVKKISMDFKVKDVRKSAGEIAGTARKLGGMVTHYNISSEEYNSKTLPVSDDSLLVITSYRTSAYMIVRVPSADLEEFIGIVSSTAAFIRSSKLDIDDMSLDFLESTMKQENRKELFEAGASVKGKISQVGDLLRQRDVKVEEHVKNMRIDADVKFSSITLTFFQNDRINKEIIANNDLTNYALPFSRNIANAFYSGWDVFLSAVVGLTHLWMFILLALIILFGYRSYKKWKPAEA